MKAISALGRENNFDVDTTRDATIFNDNDLKEYDAIVFLSTTGNVLNNKQQTAFERYIQAGGGYVGVHSAAATEYEWPWYAKLMGAQFSSHPHNPGVRPGVVYVTDSVHDASKNLPKVWKREEEWYSYKSFYPDLKVLAMLDENSYVGGTNGSYHPIAWYHEFDGGRAFYTGLGHQDETYSDPEFLQHLLGGITYAMAKTKLDYSKAYSKEIPEDNRFIKTVLTNDLDSPMELAVSQGGEIYFTELKSGKLQCYDTRSGSTKLIHQFNVCTTGGTGLIGVALDPGFSKNHFIYLYYTPPTEEEPIIFNLSRFTMTTDHRLDLASEKILIKVPVQKNSGAHHGGSLAWDENGNLYLSTGDSSSPFPSNGYAPLDERPGDEYYSLDSQRGASNSNDFKGKVLRIHPNNDGTYSIPEGNLFAAGMDKAKPEIFVMGCRNPYRIAVNKKTSTLYWGDIGPDAGKDSIQGPMGYDEFNQARAAGNFGWPYFVANNQPYSKWNFVTNTAGPIFDPAHPVNESPNNTGIKNLPAAMPAMIWYPYLPSREFPELGSGGRSAMAGDFYFYNEQAAGKKFPEYFDGGLFVFDWMRNWVVVLRFDDDENYLRSEPFMFSNGDFRRPIDLTFGSDGVMYMLEYGSVYGVDNDDARLVKIEYNNGNRSPRAVASIEDSLAYADLNGKVFLTSELKGLPLKKKIIGAKPLRVKFSSKGSTDPDDDNLSLEWLLNGQHLSTGADANYTFTTDGTFNVVLKVTDTNSSVAYDTLKVLVGNEQPEISIQSPDNRSFYWASKPFRYNIAVSDKDGKIDETNILATLNSHVPNAALPIGLTFLNSSDCKACHTVDKLSVGPSFKDIAKRYKQTEENIAKLSSKIISGGGGAWGSEHVMSAHPQISAEQAREIVKYILNIESFAASSESVPKKGIVNFPASTTEPKLYIVKASYTDAGTSSQQPVSNEDVVTLRNSTVPAYSVDEYVGFQRFRNELTPGNHKAYFLMKNIDLKNLNNFNYEYASLDKAGEIEVRMDSFGGPVISTVKFDPTGDWDSYKEIKAQIDKNITGMHNLYFILIKRNPPNDNILKMKSIRFE